MQGVSRIELASSPPQLAAHTSHPVIENKAAYQRELKALQGQMRQLQAAYFQQGRRALVVFEGWDAAGKGGAIRRIAEVMDPRGFRVYPIAAPHPEEQSRHYLYRFQRRLPPAGCIAVFDRSYYGRVLVERVDGLAPDGAWQRAYQEINEFERLLMDDGVRIVKFFMHITAAEQRKRLLRRIEDPTKQWKISDEDLRNVEQRACYTEAINDMLQRTSTVAAPWQLIAANHKWYARLAVLRQLVGCLEQDVDLHQPVRAADWLAAARRRLE